MTRIAVSAWLLVLMSGCLIGENDVPDEPKPMPMGLVTEPALGAVLDGDPSTISLRVAGVHNVEGRSLMVQVLADPDDPMSWETIASMSATEPQADGKFGFSAVVRPVTGSQDAARWPAGGVLRLRVVDDMGRKLPHDPAAPDDHVIAVVNPRGMPRDWMYLMEKPRGSPAETQAYYAAINAPATLGEFMARYGFPGDEVVARYYNAGDLGIGREMHCRATEAPAGGLACYVKNFGAFGGSRDEAISATMAGGTPLATVAMMYTPPMDAPNAVKFMVYNASNSLMMSAQLDTSGDNTSVPQNCLTCHGGRSRYDAATQTVMGARFLAFDPAMFAYGVRPDVTFAAQEDAFRRLNRLVAGAAPSMATRELIEGIFPIDGSPYDPAFVPPGWSESDADARVYREVIAPYCRNCHASFSSGSDDMLALRTASAVRKRAEDMAAHVCGAGPHGMPAAEQTSMQFFRSPARAIFLQWLDQPGACVPR
jgi:hypothetical protein